MEFFILVRGFGEEASEELLLGGAMTESSSTARGVLALLIRFTGNFGDAGDDERDKASTAAGITEGVVFELTGVGLLSALEDVFSLFGRRSDPGVDFAAIIFDIGRGVDSSSGRNSFSSSTVMLDESLVSMI